MIKNKYSQFIIHRNRINIYSSCHPLITSLLLQAEWVVLPHLICHQVEECLQDSFKVCPPICLLQTLQDIIQVSNQQINFNLLLLEHLHITTFSLIHMLLDKTPCQITQINSMEWEEVLELLEVAELITLMTLRQN